jgi:hypothetical protein
MIVIVHLTWSCVDPISFQTNSENDQLVFYGVFTQLEESHSFSISRTLDFGLPPVPVSDATIQRIFTLPYLIGDHEIIETCPKTRTFIIEDKCCFCSLLDEAENRINRPEYWND